MTGLVDEGRAVDIVYLDFRTAFDTITQQILIEKLIKYGLDEQPISLWWIETWLKAWAERVVISGMKSS